MRLLLSASVLLLGHIAVAPATAQTVVSTCGQSVSGSAVLSADLDCTGFTDDAVVLQRGGKLDLAGFTLTGGDGDGVFCEGSCRVFSSSAAKGRVVGAAGDGVGASFITPLTPQQVTVSNLVVDGNGGMGVAAGSRTIAKVSVEDSEITNNGLSGVSARDKVSVKRSLVTGNAIVGVGTSHSAIVLDSIVDGNGDDGCNATRFRCKNSSFSSNGGDGLEIAVDRLKMKNCVADGNSGRGLFIDFLDRKVKITDSSLSGNSLDGIQLSTTKIFEEGAIQISDTQVNGNAGHGIWTGDHLFSTPGSLRLKRATISGNGMSGISGRFREDGIDLKQSAVTGNGLHGVEHRGDDGTSAGPCEIVSRGSTFSGNGTLLACGVSETCADISACEAPDIASTECTSDYVFGSGFPGSAWGICQP